jgi:hypothetical protein
MFKYHVFWDEEYTYTYMLVPDDENLTSFKISVNIY